MSTGPLSVESILKSATQLAKVMQDELLAMAALYDVEMITTRRS
jgi:hypothetical protein